MKTILSIFLVFSLSGCASVEWVKKVWPRSHDPQLVSQWVDVKVSIDSVNCEQTPTGWAQVVDPARKLSIYAEFRKDPQQENLKGLLAHAERMSKGGSKAFCEIGKKTAQSRLDAARTAWEGR